MRADALLCAMSVLSRIPSLFIAHGGGPFPVLGDPGHAGLVSALKRLPTELNIEKPKAILVVSAHWEESMPTVTSGPNPPLIYDYYGFPPESYQLKYPAPGNPVLAKKVANLLTNAGIECREDPTRGFDHGVFIPLMLTYPEATVPVVQLSLVNSLDPGLHLRIGEALAPLREENILIFGSGMSFHNMSVFMKSMGNTLGGKPDPKSVEFDNYLKTAVGVGSSGGALKSSTSSVLSLEERKAMLMNWKRGPSALYAHPREEHLLPLMVAFGAAGGDLGAVVLSEPLLGAQVSSFAFGQVKPGECAATQ